MSHTKNDPSPDGQGVAPPERRARRTTRALGVALAAACASLAGCKIVLVSGPAEVAVGDTVAYVLEIHPTTGLLFPFFVVADVPEGWQLESATYVGTAGGMPISGNGLVVQDDACGFFLTERPGFRRWYVQNPTLPPEVTSTDSAEVTLEFFVESQPEGEFSLYFMLAGSDCSSPELFTVNRRAGPRFLRFVEKLIDGGGPEGPVEIVRSPDGRHLYVAGAVDRSIGVFARDAADGRLSLLETETEGLDDGLGPPTSLTMSPDGLYVYVPRSSGGSGNTSGLLIFARDPMTGALTFVERVIEDLGSVVVSPDGLSIYAETADDEIVVFSRDPPTGRLTFVDTLPFDGRLAPSLDSRHLYAASFGDLFVFERDTATGALSLVDSLTPGGRSPVFSPDGRHLYVLGSGIDVFSRDETTGLLTLVENVPELITEPVANFTGSLALSPDGRHLVVGGSVAVSVFERDPVTGRLTFVENQFMGNLPAESVSEPVFSLDSRHLYAITSGDGVLSTFATAVVFGDGFESGTTSAWSSAVP